MTNKPVTETIVYKSASEVIAEANIARSAAIRDGFSALFRVLISPLKRRIAGLSSIEAHAA